jgi:hypothetical protein
MHAHKLLTAAFAAIAMVLVPSAAYADGYGNVNCDLTPNDPQCTVVAVNPGTGGSGGGGGGSVTCTQGGKTVPCYDPDLGWLGQDGCRYKLDPAPTNGGAPPAGKDPSSGAWYMRTCPVGNSGASGGLVWLDYRDAPILGTLITQALAELRMPRPRIGLNPAPPAPQVVFVPTWLWVNPAIWRPQKATAAVPGLSVTAVATPTKVTWTTGDDSTTVCNGPGAAWTSTDKPLAASDCSHTYTTTSRTAPGGTFTLRATITWSGGAFGGTEPAATTADEVAIEVTELLPVITH